MDGVGFMFLALVFWIVPVAIGAYILYWVIRLAVRHGLEDRDRRAHLRAQAAQRGGYPG